MKNRPENTDRRQAKAIIDFYMAKTPAKAKTKAPVTKAKPVAKPAKVVAKTKPAKTAKVIKAVAAKVIKMPKVPKPKRGKGKVVSKPTVKPLVAPKPIKPRAVTQEPENAAFGATKIERTILEAIRTAKLGLPDWPAVAKAEHISLDYLNNRVDWMRRMDMI